ncbi:unnamed protein product [Brugia timori]|uniref:Uncharacterized protein n=1 Tax=Brugia timori TaxID=42155 RepID=A0A3P7Y5Q3_9BILA|nr:unnamed protein product [Brugia timori]
MWFWNHLKLVFLILMFLMGTSWSSNAELQNYYEQQALEQVALQNVLLEHKRALECNRSENKKRVREIRYVLIDEQLFQLANTRKLISSQHMTALLVVSLMLVSQKMKQSHLYILPVVPFVIGLFHNFDQQRDRDVTLDTIKENAEKLRRENRRLFEPIGGPITLDELDRRINRAKYHKEKESDEAN